MKRILAIDVGSNTIKCLLADAVCSCGENRVEKIFETTRESRISVGGGNLVPDASKIIAESIRAFIDEARAASKIPFEIRAAGTSALRDARKSAELLDGVERESGCRIKILSGEDEARLACLGAFCDSALRGAKKDESLFFDLGGGSMEAVLCRDAKVLRSCSLRLGAVRLTREFVENPSRELDAKVVKGMRERASDTFSASGFFGGATMPNLIGSGGAVSAARIIKRREGTPESENKISRNDFEKMLGDVSSVDCQTRCEKYGVSRARADILPAAFAVICALMEFSGARYLSHTFFNLRYGLAAAANFDVE